MDKDSYRAQGIDAGVAEILEIEKNHPDVAGWAQFDLRDAEFQQCDACRTLEFDDLAGRTGYTLQGFGQKQHESWDALKKAAESGCHTCRLFHLVRLHQLADSSGYSIRNGMTHVRVARENSSVKVLGPDMEELRLRWSTLPDCPQGQLGNNEENGTSPARFVEDNPASEEAFSRAKTWINNCLTEHKHCRTNDKVALPTRVLDIEAANSTGLVRLFETHGLSSKYIALSHCWGSSSETDENIIRTCTTSNFNELKDGFPISRMPRNFQDAVLVATKLGVRYVWIDSFCIIQDSADDWSLESLRMSEVYGSSFLTIYASSTGNSDVGFLGPRPPERYLKTKLCRVPRFPEHWVWICWPPSDLVWSFDEMMGKLWHRSWAFQELVLPTRILEYGPHMMHWRCNKQHIEEVSKSCDVRAHDGYKELMWILGLPNINSSSSNAVPLHPEFEDHHRSISIYSRWYGMIQGFSGRDLTYERDKLPAISGLANKIQQITGDVYMAGLWKRDIAAGLCWGARFPQDLVRPSTYIAPSWSWASTKGHVDYKFNEEREFEIQLVGFNLATEPLNPLGQVFSGSITLSGSIRKIDHSKNTVYVNKEWDYKAEKSRAELISNGSVKKGGRTYQFALKDQENVADPLGGGICSMSFDTGLPPPEAQAWLLKMVVPKHGEMPKEPDISTLIPDGIIVEKVAHGDEYRRIGVYACLDAMAEWIKGPEISALLGWEQRTITII